MKRNLLYSIFLMCLPLIGSEQNSGKPNLPQTLPALTSQQEQKLIAASTVLPTTHTDRVWTQAEIREFARETDQKARIAHERIVQERRAQEEADAHHAREVEREQRVSAVPQAPSPDDEKKDKKSPKSDIEKLKDGIAIMEWLEPKTVERYCAGLIPGKKGLPEVISAEVFALLQEKSKHACVVRAHYCNRAKLYEEQGILKMVSGNGQAQLQVTDALTGAVEFVTGAWGAPEDLDNALIHLELYKRTMLTGGECWTAVVALRDGRLIFWDLTNNAHLNTLDYACDIKTVFNDVLNQWQVLTHNRVKTTEKFLLFNESGIVQTICRIPSQQTYDAFDFVTINGEAVIFLAKSTGVIEQLNMTTNTLTTLFDCKDHVTMLKYISINKEPFLIMILGYGQMLLYSLSTHQLSFLTGHQDNITAMDLVIDDGTIFTQQGTPLFVTASQDGTIRIWDLSLQQCIKTINAKTNHIDMINACVRDNVLYIIATSRVKPARCFVHTFTAGPGRFEHALQQHNNRGKKSDCTIA